jgi:hypothetical protein
MLIHSELIRDYVCNVCNYSYTQDLEVSSDSMDGVVQLIKGEVEEYRVAVRNFNNDMVAEDNNINADILSRSKFVLKEGSPPKETSKRQKTTVDAINLLGMLKNK